MNAQKYLGTRICLRQSAVALALAALLATGVVHAGVGGGGGSGAAPPGGRASIERELTLWLPLPNQDDMKPVFALDWLRDHLAWFG